MRLWRRCRNGDDRSEINALVRDDMTKYGIFFPGSCPFGGGWAAEPSHALPCFREHFSIYYWLDSCFRTTKISEFAYICRKMQQTKKSLKTTENLYEVILWCLVPSPQMALIEHGTVYAVELYNHSKE